MVDAGLETRTTLSSLLRKALHAKSDDALTVGTVLDRLGERGFGLLLVILAFPLLVPVLPPGTSAVIGLLYVLISFQLLVGRTQPWLPRRVRDYRLSSRSIGILTKRGIGLFERIERYARPRLAGHLNAFTRCAVALIIMAIGLLVSLPVPFMNTLPAVALMLIGIGLSYRDQLFLYGGVLLCLAIAVFLGWGSQLLYKWGRAIWHAWG